MLPPTPPTAIIDPPPLPLASAPRDFFLDDQWYWHPLHSDCGKEGWISSTADVNDPGFSAFTPPPNCGFLSPLGPFIIYPNDGVGEMSMPVTAT